MKEVEAFRLQAWLDGELSQDEARDIEQLIASDAEAKALASELRATRAALSSNESVCSLPVSGDFYWHGIQQAIQKSAMTSVEVPARTPWVSLLYKLLVPAGAALALGMILVPLLNHPSPLGQAANFASFNVESTIPDSSVVAFHSESEGVTVVWMDTQ